MDIDSSRIHELKNKLAVILGFCELLLGEMAEDDKHRRDLLQIQDAARAALGQLPPLPWPGLEDTDTAVKESE